jgi:hypothetical protein
MRLSVVCRSFRSVALFYPGRLSTSIGPIVTCFSPKSSLFSTMSGSDAETRRKAMAAVNDIFDRYSHRMLLSFWKEIIKLSN